MTILFCEHPLNHKTVDPDFENEFQAASSCGFNTLLFSFETLTIHSDPATATKRIRKNDTLQLVLYRGWMLKPSQYNLLYSTLLEKNYQLINSPIEYQHTHYLPDNYPSIENITPKTIWLKIHDLQLNFEEVLEKVSVFGNSSVIIKDFVKSQKHYWDTACFVPSAADHDKLRSVIKRFLELQGADLNEGIVIREFIPLNDLTIHSKSGMPLKQEYRLFFFQGHLLGCYNYWEEGSYAIEESIQVSQFEELAKRIQSNFFSMDIAKTTTGEWIVIELGDGQVAGIPDTVEKMDFYSRLKTLYI